MFAVAYYDPQLSRFDPDRAPVYVGDARFSTRREAQVQVDEANQIEAESAQWSGRPKRPDAYVVDAETGQRVA